MSPRLLDAEQILPPGMFNQWPLDVLLQITKPFTGLVILIDLATTHRRAPRNESLLKLITGCVAGFLGDTISAAGRVKMSS